MKRLVLFMMAVMLLSITVNAQKKGGKTLVAYFSATGTTARAAKLVAEAVDGTLYEIQPAKKYTAADLDWHDKASRSSVEMSDSKSRPALYSKLGSLVEYDTIYIGFPIWWNLAPRIINTMNGDVTINQLAHLLLEYARQINAKDETIEWIKTCTTEFGL